MDQKDLRTLKIFEKIEDEQPPSQRALAKELGISLGLVNSFIKRLVNKGYFKVTNIPKNRVRYLLTPKGIAEKTRLTYEYLQYSFDFYRDARKKLGKLFKGLETEGVKRIAFYGVSDFAEIAYISLQETSLQLVAVIDAEKIGYRFFGITVSDSENIDSSIFDRVLISAILSTKEAEEYLLSKGVPGDRVIRLE